jgi:predicted TIM-barrel fold metal-dependent hydrolase
MLYECADLINPLMQNIGPIAERELPSMNDVSLLDGIEVISPDNHWELTGDIFYEGFPAHLKAKAPRVWFERYWRFGQPGVKEAQGIGKNVSEMLTRGQIQTAFSHEVRTKHLAAEGVGKEIVFPTSLLGYQDPDPEVREWMYSVYNKHMSEQHSKNPNFYGVGICRNWWDPAKIQSAVDELVDLGLKTFLMPNNLKGGDNKEISYADPAMDIFWRAVSKSGLPVCFHVGEPSNFEGRGALATGVLLALAPFRKSISQLVFGGVFDRFPDVKCVFVEGGISWVIPWLQDAEMLYDSYGTLLEPTKHRPTHYWRNNCYATFQADQFGLANLDILGADRVMWAMDYPHSEGTFGYTWKAMEAVVKAVGRDKARLILGGTAKKLYDL